MRILALTKRYFMIEIQRFHENDEHRKCKNEIQRADAFWHINFDQKRKPSEDVFVLLFSSHFFLFPV